MPMKPSTHVVLLAFLIALSGGLMARASDTVGPVINVRDYGARGDGVSNDTLAFHAASQALQEAGGGTLVIPTGTYIVGLQTHGLTPDHPSPGYRNTDVPYWKQHPIIALRNVDGVVIEGNGATLRVADGMHYGGYDPVTGEPIAATPEPNVFNPTLAAAIGSLIDIHQSSHIIIRDLELDGNVEKLDIGGIWSSHGRQLSASGIQLYNNR
ncbi:MAG: hypothetical protein HQ523_08580, partial [Lentisphaerae bacterium]|nr:hypothetical protein [Lentisphaerota bacterium]